MEQFVLENTLGVCSVEEDKLILKWLNFIRDDNIPYDPDKLDEHQEGFHRSDSVLLTKNVKNRLYGRDVFSGTVDAVTGEPCEGRRIYSHTQEVYEGPFQNGKRHGPGAVSTRLDGTSKFLGSYHDDYMQEGCLVTDEHTYNGFFLDNQFHGKGVLVHADGSIFEGTFNMGAYDHGTLTTEHWTYIGSFGPNQQRDGLGRLMASPQNGGNVYEGDFKNDKKHGIGVETRANGYVHHGNWENDLPHGHGTLKTERVELTGCWKDGLTLDGPGWTIQYPNFGVLYEGEAKGGRPHGKGNITMSSSSGATVSEYMGEFCQGLRHGYGSSFSPTGQVVYEGLWIGDEPADRPLFADNSQLLSSRHACNNSNIQCPEPHEEPELEPNDCNVCLKTASSESSEHQTLLYDDGDSYCGQVDENLNREGYGVYTVKATGKTYSGEWCCSQLQGMGTIKFLHLGATYVGMLVDSQMEGMGCLQFPDGSEYKGCFSNGMMHGCGKLRDAVNSCVYSGEFKEGQKHGHGKEKLLSDGTFYEGDYAHNERHGQGRLYRRTTSCQDQKKKKTLIYQGEFQNGMRSGKGERLDCTFPCTGTYVGEFIEGRQEGHGVFTTASGFSYEGEWNDGIPLDGDWVITEPNDGIIYYGSAVRSPSLANGLPVPEGFGSQKNNKGDFYTGSWVNGKRHGTGMCVFGGTGEQWDGRWRNGVFVKFGRRSPYDHI